MKGLGKDRQQMPCNQKEQNVAPGFRKAFRFLELSVRVGSIVADSDLHDLMPAFTFSRYLLRRDAAGAEVE